MLETPLQDTDSQSDESFYGYIHCTTGLNCNIMILPDDGCHLQHPYTSTSNCSEEFMLETPLQDTDSQSDESFYGYIHCTTGLNCNIMILPDENP